MHAIQIPTSLFSFPCANQGATILKLLDVEHPAAKILVELAQQQDKEVPRLGCFVFFFPLQLFFNWLVRSATARRLWSLWLPSC